MIADFIESALIIDDKKEEIFGLMDTLEAKGIAVTFYTPDKIGGDAELKNRKIIFLDLYLDPTITDLTGNISKIRKILKDKIGMNYGLYGIVLWSAHSEEIEQFQEKIYKDRQLYTHPLFIVGLNKTIYTKNDNYQTLFDDINNELGNNTAATFFLEWSNSVRLAQEVTISSIYSLMPDYKNQSDDIKFILQKLALNHTGISDKDIKNYPSLYIDAYKSFDEILNAELINCQKSKKNIFADPLQSFSQTDKLSEIYSQINSAMFIDDNNIVQNIVMPGNVYEQIYEDELLKIDGAPKKAKKIVIEITPPCDFSNKKNGNPRVVSGFMLKWPEDVDKQDDLKKSFRSEACYKIYPIKIKDIKEPQFFCFDFRYITTLKKEDLKNELKYRILFRAKPKLFADIIQKFSSHAARLGLSVINEDV